MKTYKALDLINHDSEFFKILRRLPHPSIDGPWIAGGSVWKAMEAMPLECDIDFFFKDEAQLNETKRLMNSIPYINRIVKEKQNRFNTTYDVHIFDGDYENTVKVQFISFKQWPNPKELLDAFDFTACQFLLDGESIHVGDDSIEHVKARQIVLNRVKKSELTLHHLQRYLNKGFTISDEQKKLLEDFKAITNKEIIRNQETGNLEFIERTDNEDWTNYNGRDVNEPHTNQYNIRFTDGDGRLLGEPEPYMPYGNIYTLPHVITPNIIITQTATPVAHNFDDDEIFTTTTTDNMIQLGAGMFGTVNYITDNNTIGNAMEVAETGLTGQEIDEFIEDFD